jgi:hypothetical protein
MDAHSVGARMYDMLCTCFHCLLLSDEQLTLVLHSIRLLHGETLSQFSRLTSEPSPGYTVRSKHVCTGLV